MSLGTVLVTGGAGYIGSFTSLALLEAGYEVIVVDNLDNASKVVLDRIELLCGKRPDFHTADVTDEDALDKVFEQYPKGSIDCVVHFAARKAVGESAIIPLDYYRTNVYGAVVLLKTMERHLCTNIVFSSSATVYGDATRFPDMIPIPEECPIGPTNPYGNTKAMVETIITDWVSAARTKATKDSTDASKWNGAFLRYFNPAGAHPSGLMGEDPLGVPYNLMPLLGQVAYADRKELLVFGDDYASKDGTAIRDYIHVLDLAAGHLAAIARLLAARPGVRAWNLGTGHGSTVFDMIHAFSDVVGRPLPHKVVERRAGDVLNLTARPDRANDELGWKAERSLRSMCEDLDRWVRLNPQGYRKDPPPELLEALKKSKAAGSS